MSISSAISDARGSAEWTSGRALAGSAALALALLSLAFFVIRNWHGLWFLPFGDESEQLLGGRVLNAGGRLYEDYVDFHGPVIFVLAQFYGALFGWSDPNTARLMEPAFVLIAAGSVAASPALAKILPKLWGVSLMLGGLAAVWLVQGLYLVSFYPIAGMLAVVGLAGFVAGAWSGRTISTPIALVSGIAFALLVFTAYSFGPSVVLFAVSGCWAALRGRQPRAALMFLAGGAIGTCAMLVWLVTYSDLRSYLAIHIAFNQTAYAPFIGFSVRAFLASLVPSTAPAMLVQGLALLFCAASALLFIAMDLSRSDGGRRQTLPILVGYVGVPLLNARGMTIFQNGTFLVASLGLLSVALPAALVRVGAPRRADLSIAASVLLGLCITGMELAARRALSTPGGLTREQIVKQPRYLIDRRVDDAYFDKVRSVVRPGERVLALVYWPEFYWAADRLPMRGYYEYLPWSAAYAKAPWFGRTRDLCVDLVKSPPPLVEFDNWTVWGRYKPQDYMPCVLKILAAEYRPLAGFPKLYVRQDRAPSAQ